MGRLAVIESAYGLMAGYGMQLHMIVQDFNQLSSIYEKRWQTFIANSGVIQVFGTNDLMTAEYISKLCGVTTIESLSQRSAEKRAGLFADPQYLSREDSLISRKLITPEEIITMHPAAQILSNQRLIELVKLMARKAAEADYAHSILHSKSKW